MLTYLGQSFDKRELADLAAICRQGLSMLQASLPGKLTLEANLPSPGPAVMVNKNEILQVLTNLMTNAWEALGDGSGSVRMSVKTVPPADISRAQRYPMDWQPGDNHYACLEVTDTGCGVASNDIEMLFDPFYTSKFTGRGLGLAVALGIVKAHEGVITVESHLGGGSIFRVFLPVSAQEAPRKPAAIIEIQEDRWGGTILLVEDEEMVRDMAATMLKRLGFEVREAMDGVQAIDIFEQFPEKIRLVICDLTMPRMDGWETLTALRKINPEIPVILASGYDKAQVMAGEHAELPQAFLGKPYKLKGLSDAIRQALAKRC
jgi:CheY-like chemotaxis protein